MRAKGDEYNDFLDSMIKTFVESHRLRIRPPQEACRGHLLLHAFQYQEEGRRTQSLGVVGPIAMVHTKMKNSHRAELRREHPRADLTGSVECLHSQLGNLVRELFVAQVDLTAGRKEEEEEQEKVETGEEQLLEEITKED